MDVVGFPCCSQSGFVSTRRRILTICKGQFLYCRKTFVPQKSIYVLWKTSLQQNHFLYSVIICTTEITFCTMGRIMYYRNHFLFCGKNSVLQRSLSVLWEEFCTTEITFCIVGRTLHYRNNFLYRGGNSHYRNNFLYCGKNSVLQKSISVLWWALCTTDISWSSLVVPSRPLGAPTCQQSSPVVLGR